MSQISACAFPDVLRVRIPAGLRQALAMASRVHNQTASEFTRQTLISALADEGIRIRNGRVRAELRESA